jgi:hypothetical protein
MLSTTNEGAPGAVNLTHLGVKFGAIYPLTAPKCPWQNLQTSRRGTVGARWSREPSLRSIDRISAALSGRPAGQHGSGTQPALG